MTIGDQYGIPLSSATVGAKFNGSDWLGGKNATYYVPGTTQTTSLTPPANILSYMGKTTVNYNVTDTSGKVKIPYLTEIIYGNPNGNSNLNGWPNSIWVGSINVTVRAGSFSARAMPNFTPYPAMDDTHTTASESCNVPGASAATWDSSKYLVVPPSLNLTGNFTHFGDVIVKSTGTLTLQNISFDIDRNPGETAKVTVFNGGTLIISDATFSCDQPLDLQIKSGGRLIIVDSTLSSNIAITAHGNATVRISGSLIPGSFTIDSDANMTMEIKDTDFTAAPTFGGSSVVSLVNVTAPAINQEDASCVALYRYAMVTVRDLTGIPLPGTVVTARYQAAPANETGTSNSSGIAGLKLLTAWMNASGGSVATSYFGNYLLSAAYNHPPTYYAPDASLSFGTFSAPLTNANIELTMIVQKAFADLTFGTDGIYTSLSPPTSGTSTMIYAQIENTGGEDALSTIDVVFYYNVMDVPHLIGTYSMAGLGSGDTDVASVTWLNPPADIFNISVEINPLRTVIEWYYTNNNDSIPVTMWDHTKYIVVPPSLTLTGNFTHLGDILVKSTGTLTLQDIVFNIDRNPGETAKVTVFNGGTLIISDATFSCD